MAASLSLSEKERLHSAVSGYTAGSFKGSSVCVGEGIIAVCHIASLAWAVEPLLLKKNNKCSAKNWSNFFPLQQSYFCSREVQKDYPFTLLPKHCLPLKEQ